MCSEYIKTRFLKKMVIIKNNYQAYIKLYIDNLEYKTKILFTYKDFYIILSKSNAKIINNLKAYSQLVTRLSF